MRRFHGLCGGALVALASVTAARPVQPPAIPAAHVVVDLRVAGRPLREIAAHLSTQAGDPVTVDREVAEWKATVAYRGALAPLIRALCRNFRLVIEDDPSRGASGASSTPGYRLVLDPDEHRRLAKREAARARAARERQDRDAAALVDQVCRLLARGPGPADPSVEGPDGSPLAHGAEPILQLLGTFGTDALTQLSRSTPLDAGGALDKAPTLTMPVSGMSAAQRRCVETFLTARQKVAAAESPGGAGIESDNLSRGLQQLDQARVAFWTLNLNGGQSLHMSMHFAGMTWTPDYPVVVADAPAGPKAATGPKAGPADKSAPTQPTPQEDGTADLSIQSATYADAVLALAEAAGVSVVADAFSLRKQASGAWVGAPLRTMLGAICEQLHVGRRWVDDTLLLRADGWEDLLPEEPPAEVLHYVAERLKNAGRLTSVDMMVIAAHMTRAQVAGLQRWRGPHGSVPMSVATRLLSHLEVYAWLGGLPVASRNALLSSELTVRSLSPVQRVALTRLVASVGLPPPDDDAVLRLTTSEDPNRPDVLLALHGPNGAFITEVR